jgi:hypothetical protein
MLEAFRELFQQACLLLTLSDAPNRDYYCQSGTSFLPITDAPTNLNSRRKLMEKWRCTCSAARQIEVLYRHLQSADYGDWLV